MKKIAMDVVTRKITDITPYEKNPRYNDEAVKFVVASIEKFGFKQPIVVDKNGVIVVGHTRYKAALELGLEEVPVTVADDLTDEEIKAYRLADNKVGEIAKWNQEMLDFELGEIDIDMTAFGFIEMADIDVDGFFEDAEPKESKEEEEKEVQCPHCGMFFKVN